jgi:phenylacetate-CoA ligase
MVGWFLILNNIETIPQDEIQKIQLEKLNLQLRTLNDNCPLYKELFDSNSLEPKVSKLEDLAKFPVLTEDMLVENTVKDKKNIFAGRRNINEDKIMKVFSNEKFPYQEGTPYYFGYSTNDYEKEVNILIRMLFGVGVYQGSYVHAIVSGLDPLTYSIYDTILRMGCRWLGGFTIDIDLPRIFDSMRLEPSVLISPWSMLSQFNKYAKKNGFDEETYFLNYQKVLVYDIIWELKRAEKLQGKGWGNAEFYSFRKINIPGFYACECEKHDGLHYPQEEFFIEIVDPENHNELVADGERGQMLITNLTREATPCIRYTPAKPLFASKHLEKCECGRNIARLKFLK